MKISKSLILMVILGIFIITGYSISQSAKIERKKSDQWQKNPVKIHKTKVSNEFSDKKKLKTNKNSSDNKRKMNILSYLLFEDFESGNVPPSGWNADGTWNAYNVSGYGIGDYSAIFAFYDNPPNDAMTTDYFSPSGGEDTLTFDIAYTAWDNGGEDTTSFTDAMTLYYSTDDGSTFNYLVYLSTDSMKTAPCVGYYFVPEAGQWKTMKFVLPTGTNRIQFGPESGWGNNLFIDNVIVNSSISGGGNEASVEKVWAKGKLPLVYGVPDKISALIKNNSGSAMTNLKVYLNITGTSFLSDSLEIPSIGAGDTLQIDFNGFTPVLNGFSTVTISVPDDDDNGNNSKDFLSEANTNSMRYVDSNCCNGSVGWIGEYSFLNKYKMTGTGQIRKVNIKISGDGNVGQIVYATVLDNTGTIVGKSPHYKIQASDQGTYKTFDITDPKPFIVSNDYYYVGIAQTQYSGDGFAFTPQEFLSDSPARPDANYYAGLAPIGTTVGTGEFPREYGQNYAIEAVIGNQATIDAGVSDLGLTYDQYFSVTSFTPVGRVFNAGTGSATFTVNRKITPGGYTSTKTVTALVAGGNANVTFDPWTFTSGTTYTIRDSVILSGDGNISNNAISNTITPRIAKQMCVLWQQQDDRDSLVRAINTDGRFANNFDTVRMNYTGSYRGWKYIFANFKNESNYAAWTRDSLKAYLDNSTAGNKKTLVVFGNGIALSDDPEIGFPSPADSVFYRQYLKSKTISDDWATSIPSSQGKFRGIGSFSGIAQDSISDPNTPELIMPVNGGIPAFKPKSVTGNGNDSCNAVCYAGTSFNSFFMTNKFSSLRSTYESPLDGPVLVYTKIIDWLQNIGSSAKVLNINILPEGLYDVNTNTIIRDTIRVYLRNATSPFAKVDSGKVYLSASGQGTILFNNAANGVNYYLQVIHRNSMETWSGTPKMFTSNLLSYDFTDASSKAYGDNMKLSGTNWVIFTGDAIDFGTIDAADLSLIESAAGNSEEGYINADLNNDLIVDAADISLVENNVAQGVYLVSPLTLLSSVSKEDNIFENLNKEYRIDNEIYERFKNVQMKQSRIPELIVIDKNKTQSIITGMKK